MEQLIGQKPSLNLHAINVGIKIFVKMDYFYKKNCFQNMDFDLHGKHFELVHTRGGKTVEVSFCLKKENNHCYQNAFSVKIWKNE